jgi:CRP-like cAMP-binding protein
MYDQSPKFFSTDNHNHSTGNHILDALPKDEFQRIEPFLEPVTLSHGTILCHPEDRVKDVYFPTEGMISVTSISLDGKSVQIATVAKEGMTGIETILGVDSTTHQSLVQIPGEGFRMKTEIVRSEFKQCGALHDLLLRYTHAFLVQTSQSAICNRIHTVEEKLAAWLMTTSDRVDSNCLHLTQEFIAHMFGVNRPTVTSAASKLQTDGVIEYRRGKISIINAMGLEELACDCYQTVKQEYSSYINNK